MPVFMSNNFVSSNLSPIQCIQVSSPRQRSTILFVLTQQCMRTLLLLTRLRKHQSLVSQTCMALLHHVSLLYGAALTNCAV
jgi:hypothetical protein